MECSRCTHGARCVSTPLPEELGNSFLTSDEEDKEDGNPQVKVDCNCDHFKCQGLATRVICGTNGVTYSNECHMKREACLQQRDIHKLHDGDCRPHCKLVMKLHLHTSYTRPPHLSPFYTWSSKTYI